jgi:hypothetical protein
MNYERYKLCLQSWLCSSVKEASRMLYMILFRLAELISEYSVEYEKLLT